MAFVRVIPGDMREELAKLGRVQSIVTDPPYGLAFMGKHWDAADNVAFQAETWRLCFDLLPPGGHLLAFAGTRTYHRMACAIEDAGFELRDTIAWLYGSGFPKSHNVSKGIDKRRDWSALPRLQAAIRAARLAIGISQSEAARRCGLIGPTESLGGGGFMWFETGMRMPTRDQWPRLREALSLGDAFDDCFEEAEREITGTIEAWENRTNFAMTTKDGMRRDVAATAAARQWDGWGTALKPAMELICVARKPLQGTVASNVIKYGTGALNIDGCRIWPADTDKADIGCSLGTREESDAGLTQNGLNGSGQEDARSTIGSTPQGRWPPNVAHDGSDEVVKAFPDTSAAGHFPQNTGGIGTDSGIFGKGNGRDQQERWTDGSGSAARFFYSSKADSDDRLGSKHPTVKPVDLMRWLVRLVTPPGGTVLDPFAGSGTTGMACMAEGFDCILIEREAEYVADIHARIAHVHGDDTPLFRMAAD